jgi:protein-S-isoprenylcysteine O-methyltransferase Ste14
VSASRPAGPRPPLSALLGTILFVALVPGSVIGLGPWLLSGWRAGPPFGGAWTRWAGVALFFAGLPVFVNFLVRFVWEGHGTPAPVAPPRRLVVGGPFRFVRNPGYLGVLAMLFGQGLFLASPAVLVYAAGVAAAFHVFVVLYEEPTLRRQFGATYEEYCREVPRWLPRLRAPRPR